MKAVIVLVMLCLGAGCSSPAPTESLTSEAKVPVKIARAEPGPIDAVVTASGTVVAAPGAELLVTAPGPALIKRLPVGEGQHVARGAVLAEFEIPALAADQAARRSDVTQARTRLALAQTTFERMTGLFERGIAARKDVEAARRERDDAEAAVQQTGVARQVADQLGARRIVRAPFAGLVVRRWHNPGDLVDGVTSDPVLRMIDPSRLEIDAQVPGADGGRVRIGQVARLRSSWSAAPVEGRVVSEPIQIDPVSSTFRVRIALTAPGALPVGLPLEVAIIVERKDRVLTVPVAALVREQSDTSVYVVAADGTARRQAVTVGLVSSTIAEILTGLTPGVQVIIEGQIGLPDGAAVTVRP